MKNKKKKIRMIISIILGITIIIIIYIIMSNRFIFKLNGDKKIEISLGEDFFDPGFKIYHKKEDLTKKVVLYDNINVNEIGTYERTYTYEDKILKRIIEVKDLKEFYLKGDGDVYLLLNGKYDDPGVMAKDRGLDYSSSIKVSNNCNKDKQGICQITYQSKELDSVLKRNIHISDFSEYFRINVEQDNLKKGIKLFITMDSDKVDSYMAPDGKTYKKDSTYVITENGEYSFIIFDKYHNKYERKIKINGIMKNLQASCEASVKNRETTIKVKANKEVLKYIYHDVESVKDTYTFNKRYAINDVIVVDKDNLSIKVECKTKVSEYNSFGAYKHVIILGADGLGASLNKVAGKNFKKIFGNFAYKHNTMTEVVTYSAQNWGSILTGVAYNIHGFTNENIKVKENDSHTGNNSIFYYVRKKYPKANLVSIVNWEPINYGIIENDINVKKEHGKNDKEVVNKVIDYLDSLKPTLMYIQLDEADGAAHSYGGFSMEYYDKVRYIDELLGKIYDKLEEKQMLDDTLLILVADHGETTTAHGGNTQEEMSAVLGIRGHSVNKMNFDNTVRNRDVAAIALYALGINIPNRFTSKVPNNLFDEIR